ncbi:MAG: transglutaminase-like domain-containing protein [candidate division Zixibacteria bacterium]
MRAVLSVFMFVFSLSGLNVAGDIQYSSDVVEALEQAGENGSELEKVFIHYGSPDDFLKLQAALFLVGNMEGHGYVTYMMHDSTGAEIDFNVLDYPDFDALLAACDILEEKKGEIDFKKNEMVYDIKTIKAEFLINQIDYAFKAWKEKPWADAFSFDSFCKYILPYRGSNEPLENWRESFLEKYVGLEKKMKDPSDPMEAASLINDDIKSWFGFDPRYYYHPTDQGLSEMLESGLGRCEDMTNLAIYALRANGLAITSDYTPFWANSGNNHAWNAIATADGQVIPFMGAESNPGVYRLANKLAKVYRKMYGKQKDNLIFQERKQEKVPRWLGGKSYLDVTASYTDVCDVSIEFEKEIPDSVDTGYLCVFNSGEWKAIQWGKIENGKAVFKDMGSDQIAYLPALYLNEEIVPYGSPFILDKNCELRSLCKNGETDDFSLISTTRRKQEISTDSIIKTYFASGKEYELFYWDFGWQSFGKSTAGDAPLKFESVPSGCLYWLVEEDSDEEERIFTIDDGFQEWW